MALNFKYLLLFLMVVLASACQKEINLKIPEQESRLVINGVFYADSSASVKLTHSVQALSNNSINNIVNATVSLKDENGNVYLLNHLGDGIYIHPQQLKSGKNYKLYVDAPGYKSANASFVLPERIQIDTAWYLPVTTNEGFDNSNELLSFKFNDPAGVENFYAISAYYIDSAGLSSKLYLQEEEGIINAGSGKSNVDGSVYFSDQYLDGKSIEQSFNYFPPYNYDSLGNPFLNGKRKLFLEQISRDLYLYMVSIQLQQSKGDNPFSEPVQIYNNIESGYGIAGGSAVSSTILSKKN